jgi:hypothetical protein
MLDAAIVEVQSRVNDRSVLRIRIDKALGKDGREVPIEAKIVALASQSSVTEGWRSPFIIADRFPRIPEDDQRLPGERREKKPSVAPCKNLLEARGVYGYKTVTLGPADPTSPAESVLTSKKDILFHAGTVLVLEVKNIPRSF